jgi:molecular chaperone HscB
MHECPRCWARPQTPLFCERCNELLEPASRPSPFEVLGLPTGFNVDKFALRKKLLLLSRRMHPDFFGTAGQEARALAERNTAELNAAFDVLSDDFRRADWLVTSLDGPKESDERALPAEFLAQVLEWNEAIEEARANGSADGLAPLEARLGALRGRLMSDVARALDSVPALRAPVLRDVRRALNAVRYLDRALTTLAELRIEHARSH